VASLGTGVRIPGPPLDRTQRIVRPCVK